MDIPEKVGHTAVNGGVSALTAPPHILHFFQHPGFCKFNTSTARAKNKGPCLLFWRREGHDSANLVKHTHTATRAHAHRHARTKHPLPLPLPLMPLLPHAPLPSSCERKLGTSSTPGGTIPSASRGCRVVTASHRCTGYTARPAGSGVRADDDATLPTNPATLPTPSPPAPLRPAARTTNAHNMVVVRFLGVSRW